MAAVRGEPANPAQPYLCILEFKTHTHKMREHTVNGKKVILPTTPGEARRRLAWDRQDHIPLWDTPHAVQRAILRGRPTNIERMNLIGFMVGNGMDPREVKQFFGTAPWEPGAMDRAARAQVAAITAAPTTVLKGHTYWDATMGSYATLATGSRLSGLQMAERAVREMRASYAGMGGFLAPVK